VDTQRFRRETDSELGIAENALDLRRPAKVGPYFERGVLGAVDLLSLREEGQRPAVVACRCPNVREDLEVARLFLAQPEFPGAGLRAVQVSNGAAQGADSRVLQAQLAQRVDLATLITGHPVEGPRVVQHIDGHYRVSDVHVPLAQVVEGSPRTADVTEPRR
jgi:hypothetical protein